MCDPFGREQFWGLFFPRATCVPVGCPFPSLAPSRRGARGKHLGVAVAVAGMTVTSCLRSQRDDEGAVGRTLAGCQPLREAFPTHPRPSASRQSCEKEAFVPTEKGSIEARRVCQLPQVARAGKGRGGTPRRGHRFVRCLQGEIASHPRSSSRPRGPGRRGGGQSEGQPGVGEGHAGGICSEVR